MPSGAGPGGRVGVGLVGRKPEVVGDASALGFGRVALYTSATTARAANASPMTQRRPEARLPPGAGDGVDFPFFFGLSFLLTADDLMFLRHSTRPPERGRNA